MRTKLNTFLWYSNPRAGGEVMRACACVWLGKRRLAAESCWYPVLALAQTLPHTTRALPSTLTYFLILHHTFLYLILLTHDYRSSTRYSRMYDNSLLFKRRRPLFLLCWINFEGARGMDFGDESTQRCY